MGFFICLTLWLIYIISYGIITNFKVDNDLDYHRNLSIFFSLIICYIIFIIVRKKLKKNYSDDLEINEIGK